jgi:hypothetical protein
LRICFPGKNADSFKIDAGLDPRTFVVLYDSIAISRMYGTGTVVNNYHRGMWLFSTVFFCPLKNPDPIQNIIPDPCMPHPERFDFRQTNSQSQIQCPSLAKAYRIGANAALKG